MFPESVAFDVDCRDSGESGGVSLCDGAFACADGTGEEDYFAGVGGC